MAGTIFLVWLGRSSPWRAGDEFAFAPMLIAVLGNAPAPIIGALIAARQPRNAYGWLWLVSGIALSFTQFVVAYAFHGLLIAPGALPLSELALSLSLPAWLLYLGSGPFVLLLFPTGRLPSYRWRIVAWAVVAATLSGMVFSWLVPREFGFVPVAWDPASPPGIVGNVAEAVVTVSVLFIFGAIIVSVFSLLLRFRRATGVERQQLKWFTYWALLLGVVLISDFFYTLPGIWESIKEAIAFNMLPPLAIGVAILRYRLYAIDILIRRTLVYGVLTACLALVYFSTIVGLQSLVRAFSNQTRDPLVTVISTLVIAALFSPLRRRIQAGIDHRFYRRKYDAERVLASFGETMRNETDLERMTAQVLAVVGETVQPVHTSLWLRRTQHVEK
jgi:hypothetical protein